MSYYDFFIASPVSNFCNEEKCFIGVDVNHLIDSISTLDLSESKFDSSGLWIYVLSLNIPQSVLSNASLT